MDPRQKNLQLIQMLRGIASMLVVLLHVSYNCQRETGHIFLYNIFEFGGSGVDIFFVLSGFIITYSNWQYLERPSAVTGFLKKRFVRVFPIYWIIITLLLLLQIILPHFYSDRFDLGFIGLLRTYLLLPNHIMINGVSWSLTNELYFYLLFTIALLLPKKRYAFILLVIYFIALLGVALLGNVHSGDFIGLLLFPMNLEFFMGVLIVVLIKKISNKMAYPILITGIALFIASAYMTDKNIIVFKNIDTTLSRVISYGIPSFLIVLGVVQLELSRTVKIKNIFLHLGDASYSIYLFHLPVAAAYYKILSHLHFTNGIVVALCTCILITGIGGAGIFIYQKIEKPLIIYLNSIFFKKRVL